MDLVTWIPVANLLVLLGIYVQVAKQNSRIVHLETWADEHVRQDDERHKTVVGDISGIRKRVHYLSGVIQRLLIHFRKDKLNESMD